MSYLVRLKSKIINNASEHEVTKGSEGAFDPFVTPYLSVSLNIRAVDPECGGIDRVIIEERAAIREFDAGFSRSDAERLALADIWIISGKPAKSL